MDAKPRSMRINCLVSTLLCALCACASPRSQPPPDLADPNLEAAPAPEFVAPELPPVLPAPTPTAIAASEMMLAVSQEVRAVDAGVLSVEAGANRLSLELNRCRFATAEPSWDAGPVDADHCREINRATVPNRDAQALVVHPGEYEFVVRNSAFERPLGFWLRREDDPNTPVLTGGGAEFGQDRSWTAELLPGRYIYSCPLSPTPDYLLIVR